MPDAIEQMVANRRLERVAVNREHAFSVMGMAELHVSTAAVLAQTNDHAMAFTAAYDGARKALAAVLAIEGLRVRPTGGAHRNTGSAAAVFVQDESLEEFEWMRQVRNATEYPDDDHPTATKQDVAEAIEAASAMVEACARYVYGRR
ncbi:HEPN domain-containing protein [Psychromicrobium xiongbiense]|uniref:HEPN domain-containing protein n=1 Tax=Psychromicrobium xiongbiense TaxID=3051184 RepID=UPI002556F356|nr:HEPN domain-containing protein [Psychromicrobium sp. YIM S02556]